MNQEIISFHYTLTNNAGEELDSSIGQEPLTFLSGTGQIIPGLEAALLQLAIGDSKSITVPAAEAYGERDDANMLKVPRENMPDRPIAVGDQFQSGEDAEALPFIAVEVTDAYVVLDANHPLAGVDLTFNVEVLAKRAATSEELSHGHAHGPEGHHH